MSIGFSVKHGRRKFQLEIADDGQLVFLNYDIEYDLSMAEFGEPDTKAIELVKKWRKNPIEFIFNYIEIPDDALSRLSMDFAESVLYIYDTVHKDGQILGEALNATKVAALNPESSSKILKDQYDFVREMSCLAQQAELPPLDALNKARRKGAPEKTILKLYHKHNAMTAAYHAAESVQSAMLSILHQDAKSQIYTTTKICLEQAARHAVSSWSDLADTKSLTFPKSKSELTPEWIRAKDEMTAWQVRRIVHCMKALQTGKLWPALDETK